MPITVDCGEFVFVHLNQPLGINLGSRTIIGSFSQAINWHGEARLGVSFFWSESERTEDHLVESREPLPFDIPRYLLASA